MISINLSGLVQESNSLIPAGASSSISLVNLYTDETARGLYLFGEPLDFTYSTNSATLTVQEEYIPVGNMTVRNYDFSQAATIRFNGYENLFTNITSTIEQIRKKNVNINFSNFVQECLNLFSDKHIHSVAGYYNYGMAAAISTHENYQIFQQRLRQFLQILYLKESYNCEKKSRFCFYLLQTKEINEFSVVAHSIDFETCEKLKTIGDNYILVSPMIYLYESHDDGLEKLLKLLQFNVYDIVKIYKDLKSMDLIK